MIDSWGRAGLRFAALLAAAAAVRADTAIDAYRAMGVAPTDVLSGTVLTARVLPGDDKQVVSITTYFTGVREQSEAVNVRFDVFQRRGEALTPIFSRDLGAENGGSVGRGDLQLIDLDADGVNEIILAFDSYTEPLIDQRLSEVLLHGGKGFVTAWAGPVEYDATRAARGVPAERRDRFRREIDFPATMRSRGKTLYVEKQMIAVAGERLPEPKLVQETFPLASEPD